MAAGLMDYPWLDGLNPEQQEAVRHGQQPLLILAGAGSGKTRVITVRIAHLIRTGQADPRSILAVTFTNRAAAEMRERAAAIAPGAGEVLIRTFHSFGAWLLRRNASAAGLSSTFAIYDDDDVQSLLKSLRPDLPRQSLRVIAQQISRAKDFNLLPEDDLSGVSGDPEFRRIYSDYESRKQAIGSADFGDLITLPIRLLQENPAVRTRLQQRFRTVLVDEYQDSNVAQYELLRELVGPETGVAVVGDDDQSIYRFRGAEVANILSFPERFPGTTVIRLEQNYRSTPEILAVANAVVKNNAGRLGKTLRPVRPEGPLPRLALLYDQDGEVAYVRSLLADGKYQETAILYRTNAQSRLFETAFLADGVPYRIVGSVRFYEREEIRDTLAFLKLLLNPRDEVAFRRIVNKPSRGLGEVSVNRILTSADPPVDAASVTGLSRKASAAWDGFRVLFQRLSSQLQDGKTAQGDLILQLVDESGLRSHYVAEDEISGTARIGNIEELVNAASLYPAGPQGLAEFLEAIDLDRSRETGQAGGPAVTLITMHNTKGLEFDRVIITGLEEGLFPRADDFSLDDLEEERRLFYVAVTRARRELHMTSCRYRRLRGRVSELSPSRFVEEIPEELITVIDRYGARLGTRSGRQSASTDETGFSRGDGVYHDDYGRGVVTRSWLADDEPVVEVRFENGQQARFLTRYTPLDRVVLD